MQKKPKQSKRRDTGTHNKLNLGSWNMTHPHL
jgi:hypothetical protein